MRWALGAGTRGNRALAGRASTQEWLCRKKKQLSVHKMTAITATLTLNDH